MLTKRIIPCLDMTGGRVVKGTSFMDLRDAGDPVEMAAFYYREGADELVFLDIGATPEGRETMVDIVERVSGQVFIPLTVGGGLRSIGDMRRMLEAGADKTAINTAAVFDPDLISRGAEKFGSQCIVVAIDARQVPGGEAPRWEVLTHGGRKGTGMDAVAWARRAVELGAGETPPHQLGPGRAAQRVRPGADPRHQRAGDGAGDCQRRGGHPRSPVPGPGGRPGGRGAGCQHLSLPDALDPRSEGVPRGEGYSGPGVAVSRARAGICPMVQAGVEQGCPGQA